MVPNRLVGEALRCDALSEISGWRLDRAEKTVGQSRFDFSLVRREPVKGGKKGAKKGARRLLLEVKSVTLVEEGVGLFPDAVTARGTRHVQELAELARSGEWATAVLFVVQRDDAVQVQAAEAIDPAFAAALAEAKDAGVRVLARRCRVEVDRVVLGEPLAVGIRRASR
jgi:sugar fermentation stimulation protein A